MTRKQENSWAETLEEQQEQKDSGSCENPCRHLPKRCPRCWLSLPGLSHVTWLCSDTGQHQAAEQPQRAAGSCLPRETTLCPVRRTPGRENLYAGYSSTSETHHTPTQPSPGASGQTPAASPCCFVPWLMLTLQSEKGQETLSSWSGSQLVPL